MALIKSIDQKPLQSDAKHLEVECSYTIVTDENGSKFLQLDTYGSSRRAIPGKKSQSLRFAPEGIAALKAIIQQNGL
ncbi:MAG: hypothetical protein LBI48_05545 [Burkholderiaceae bacterium]|jgi:hypothetical protein|nr:hypothetical protein [Burkholderiaceae bacterium]